MRDVENEPSKPGCRIRIQVGYEGNKMLATINSTDTEVGYQLYNERGR